LAALRGLAKNFGRRAIPFIWKAACSDPDEWNRYEAVKILNKLGDASILPDLLDLLKSASDVVKAGILDLIGDWRLTEYTPILEEHASSENDLLKDAAAEALAKIGRGDQ
jgi:HEAT repeat protein